MLRAGKGNQDVKAQGAALGLAALVRSSPYSIRSWLPDLLMDIAVFETDTNLGVRQTIKKAFADFWRTHLGTNECSPILNLTFSRRYVAFI